MPPRLYLRLPFPRSRASVLPRAFITHRKFRMTSTFFAANEPELESTTSTNSSDTSTPKQPLALPEVPYNGMTQLDMSSGNATVKLDHLGPMVVNVDGTLGRISNWQGMTEMEKKNTLRIVGKRNQVRLEALKNKSKEEGD